MDDWVNEELAILQGHLAFLRLGFGRICPGSEDNDVTLEYAALIERHIEEWKQLMDRHGIRAH